MSAGTTDLTREGEGEVGTERGTATETVESGEGETRVFSHSQDLNYCVVISRYDERSRDRSRSRERSRDRRDRSRSGGGERRRERSEDRGRRDRSDSRDNR